MRLLKEMMKRAIKEEDKIIKNLKDEAVLCIDVKLDKETYRIKTEYTRDRKTRRIIKKSYPLIKTNRTW